jgi:putative hydrolase of the HAD superfamily
LTVRLRGILFDLDDTLADSSGTEERVWEGVVDGIAELVPHVDRAELRRRYVDALDVHFPRYSSGEVDFTTFRRDRLAEALEPWGEVTDELFERYVAEKARIPAEMQPFPEAVAVLRSLRSRGIRVGVLTNGQAWAQRQKLEVSGLGPELDAVAISQELGVAKPLREAFGRALELLGTRAEETAMVGDSLKNDILGALEAGLAAAVWMPGARQGELPDGAHLAREIAEVPRLLGLEV